MCEECGKTQTTEAIASAPTSTEQAGTMLLARVPQGFEAKINIRLLPAREVIFDPARLSCQPRQGAPRRDAQPLDLPEGLADKLKEANRDVIGWLARDAANTTQFLADPVSALIAAGVELTRTEQKALSRTHQAMRDASVVPPGVELTELAAKASARGKVGDRRPADKPGTESTGGPGC